MAKIISKSSVLFFIPNLIGYGRIILGGLAFYYIDSCWVATVICYALSEILDAFDGMAARHFNQCSKFGAMIDMLTDRVCTISLLISLGRFYYNSYGLLAWNYFLWNAILDFVSHWYQMYATVLSGVDSHREGANWIVHIYYTYLLFIMCFGAEAFSLAAYIQYMYPVVLDYLSWKIFIIAMAVLFNIKQLISIVQLWSAISVVLGIDAKKNNEEREQKAMELGQIKKE